jgi:hypothetical protein
MLGRELARSVRWTRSTMADCMKSVLGMPCLVRALPAEVNRGLRRSGPREVDLDSREMITWER